MKKETRFSSVNLRVARNLKQLRVTFSGIKTKRRLSKITLPLFQTFPRERQLHFMPFVRRPALPPRVAALEAVYLHALPSLRRRTRGESGSSPAGKITVESSRRQLSADCKRTFQGFYYGRLFNRTLTFFFLPLFYNREIW